MISRRRAQAQWLRWVRYGQKLYGPDLARYPLRGRAPRGVVRAYNRWAMVMNRRGHFSTGTPPWSRYSL